MTHTKLNIMKYCRDKYRERAERCVRISRDLVYDQPPDDVGRDANAIVLVCFQSYLILLHELPIFMQLYRIH